MSKEVFDNILDNIDCHAQSVHVLALLEYVDTYVCQYSISSDYDLFYQKIEELKVLVKYNYVDDIEEQVDDICAQI